VFLLRGRFICESKPVRLRKKFCKGKNLLDERIELNKTYNKYLYLMSVYRGLRLDPIKTLRYLDTKKKEKEAKSNGSISTKIRRKKSKKVKK